MKIFSILVVLFSIICFNHLSAVPNDEVIPEIVKSIKTTDAKKLSSYFNSVIDLELGEIDGSYSKTQAEIVLSDFFKSNPVKSFTMNHQGSSDDGSKYIIGTYKSSSAEYRVYILLKELDKKLLIFQFQFEED